MEQELKKPTRGRPKGTFATVLVSKKSLLERIQGLPDDSMIPVETKWANHFGLAGNYVNVPTIQKMIAINRGVATVEEPEQEEGIISVESF